MVYITVLKCVSSNPSKPAQRKPGCSPAHECCRCVSRSLWMQNIIKLPSIVCCVQCTWWELGGRRGSTAIWSKLIRSIWWYRLLKSVVQSSCTTKSFGAYQAEQGLHIFSPILCQSLVLAWTEVLSSMRFLLVHYMNMLLDLFVDTHYTWWRSVEQSFFLYPFLASLLYSMVIVERDRKGAVETERGWHVAQSFAPDLNPGCCSASILWYDHSCQPSQFSLETSVFHCALPVFSHGYNRPVFWQMFPSFSCNNLFLALYSMFSAVLLHLEMDREMEKRKKYSNFRCHEKKITVSFREFCRRGSSIS